MLWMRHLAPFAVLAALTVGGAAAYQAGSRRLDSWLREKMTAALAKENLRAEIGHLSLDPLRGLVARQCKLFGGPENRLLLGTFDKLRLDADVSRLLHKQQFINSIELSDATLALPIDPENPDTPWLKITDVDARIMASGDRFQIRQAHGTLEGLRISLEGSLLKPARLQRDPRRPPGERREALDFLKQRRTFLVRVLDELKKLGSAGAPHPLRMDIHVEGDLDHPRDLQASARLRGTDFHYGAYRVSALDLAAEYSRGEVRIRSVRLRDQTGTLLGHAEWESGSRVIPFSVTSTANLPALAGAVQKVPALQEFILYEPGSLKIDAEGQWRLPAADGSAPGSLDLIGRASSGRFATSGVIFQALDGEFFIKGGDLNVRNVRLAHQSGTLDGQAMRVQDVWRYQLQLRMNPEVLRPFIAADTLRNALDRFDFEDHSTVDAEATGSGRTGDPASWTHTASVDARQFSFQGETVRRLYAGLTKEGPLTTLTGLRLVRPEGELTARKITINQESLTATIDGLASSIYPAPVARIINPKILQVLDNYRFAKPPVAHLSGSIGMKTPEANDFTITFATDGTVTSLIGNSLLPVVAPTGQVTVKGALLQIDLNAGLRAGAQWGETTLADSIEGRFVGSFPLNQRPQTTDTWQAFLTGPAKAEQIVNGVKLPISIEKGTVDFRRQRGETTGPTVQVDFTGTIRNGARFRDLTVLSDAEAHFRGVFEAETNPVAKKRADSRSRWTLGIINPGLTEYRVADKTIPFQELRLTADYRRDRLDLHDVTARVLTGTVTGSGQIDRLSTTGDYSFAVQAEDVSFGELAKLFSPGSQTAGRITGGFRLAGRVSTKGGGPDFKPRGTGKFFIREGDIFALPLLGPLSPLLSTVLPGTRTGYSKARQATATLALGDGILTTRDFEALTTAFIIKGGGEINFDTKRVSLLARVNTRGPTGMLLYPVSKLLEYEATGTTADPGWKPRVLGIPGKIIPDLGR